MTGALVIGDPPLTVQIRRSSRARRLSLRVSQLDGRISLTLPNRAPLAEAEAFAASKESWMRRQLDAQPEQVRVQIGARVPVEGQMCRIVAADVRNARRDGDLLLVPDQPQHTAVRIAAFYKAQAREALRAASDHYASQVGRAFTKLTLRDTRSRWGSCTSAGGLMYSWRLYMAPPEVLRYVAAHEVAHLVEMNHSRAFWDLVRSLDPGFDTSRKWLRGPGRALHSYRFD